MLQKIAQRLIVDRSNSGSGDQGSGENQMSNASSPSGSSSDESGAEGLSPPMLNVKQNSNSEFFLKKIISLFLSNLKKTNFLNLSSTIKSRTV